MKYVALQDVAVIQGALGPDAPAIFVVDAPEHPLSLQVPSERYGATLVRVGIRNWNDALTPWPATGLYRGNPDFGGEASVTLAELVDQAIPTVEKDAGLAPRSRAICGYSLGGLFALFTLVHSDVFCACGCLSGSVWYDGWVEHLRACGCDLAGRYAFLSLGTKEKRAARPILKGVQDCMETCASILRGCGCEVTYRLGPGNHMQHVAERFDAGLSALDGFLSRP